LKYSFRGGFQVGKNCLVIVDMQKGFINEHTEHLPPKIAEFLEYHKFDCTIATRYCNSENTACYQLGKWFDCMEGTTSAEIVPEIQPYIDRIFDKRTFSGFTPELQLFLKQEQFNKLFFCGVNTDCCVLATIFSCYDNVIDCIVIEDLCASTLGLHKHQNAIALLKDNITEKRIISTKSQIFFKS
jgi:nicotinamidase-related amidase